MTARPRSWSASPDGPDRPDQCRGPGALLVPRHSAARGGAAADPTWLRPEGPDGAKGGATPRSPRSSRRWPADTGRLGPLVDRIWAAWRRPAVFSIVRNRTPVRPGNTRAWRPASGVRHVGTYSSGGAGFSTGSALPGTLGPTTGAVDVVGSSPSNTISRRWVDRWCVVARGGGPGHGLDGRTGRETARSLWARERVPVRLPRSSEGVLAPNARDRQSASPGNFSGRPSPIRKREEGRRYRAGCVRPPPRRRLPRGRRLDPLAASAAPAASRRLSLGPVRPPRPAQRPAPVLRPEEEIGPGDRCGPSQLDGADVPLGPIGDPDSSRGFRFCGRSLGARRSLLPPSMRPSPTRPRMAGEARRGEADRLIGVA